MLLVLVALVARAGVLTELPEQADAVGVLACEPSPCTPRAAASVAGEGPVVLLETLLDLDAEGMRLHAFTSSLAEARARLVEGDPRAAGYALDRAARALDGTDATVPTQALFDLHYLRGAAAHAIGGDGAADFRKAAASAWNRDVDLPIDDPATRRAYDDAALALLHEEPAAVSLADAPPGGTWHLDGVPLGPGAARVVVLPGAHRITATSPDGGAWARVVRLGPGQHARARATLSDPDDHLTDALVCHTARTGHLDHDHATWLADRMADAGLRAVHLLCSAPDGLHAATFTREGGLGEHRRGP